MLENTILFIDDEQSILDSFKRTLKKENFSLFTANNTREGFEILETYPIRVIVSDHKMPKETGLQFFTRIMPQYPDVIKIILTGEADLNLVIEAINQGCVNKFMLKPVNYMELMFAIRSALDTYELLKTNKKLVDTVRQQQGIINSLEKQYPGITKRPEDGVYHLS